MSRISALAVLALASSAVAQVPSGIWVNTASGNRINRIGESGSVSNFAQSGSAEGIAVGADGRVYSASASSDRLQVFSSTGALIRTANTNDQPFGIAIAPNHVWVSCRSGVIQRFELDGTSRTTFDSRSNIADIAYDNVGQIWVADFNSDRVIRYDGNGVEQARVSVGDGPLYLEVTPYGELLVVCYNDCTLHKLCITTDAVIDTVSLNGLPADLTIDAFGGTWVTLPGRDSVHYHDRLFGNGREISTGDDPKGISVDFDNNIWVACEGEDRVYRYDHEGNYIQRYSTDGSPRATGDMSGVMAMIHAQPLGDADGDLHLNRAEWVSCSDVLDAADVPIEISATRNGAGVDLWMRENHHAGNFHFFYLTTQPLPGTNIGQFQHGVDPRILQANLGEMLFWNSILTPLPGLLDGFVGVTNAGGIGVARANFPDPIPGLYVGAFTMDFDTPPTLSFVRSLSLATLLN